VNLLVLAAYLAVVCAGITTSNLGSASNRQVAEASYPDTFGTTQSIRSDEFWVGTPLALWSLLSPGDARVAQMGAVSGWTMRIPTGPAQVVAFWDQSVMQLGHVIPEAVAFAAQWWLPSLLLVLALPTLFAQLGARRRYGYAAAALILLSPADIWWSMQPSTILGPSVAGCAAMLAAYVRFSRRQWLLPLIQCLVGGVLLANVASRYPVWVLILLGSLLSAVTARILFDRRGHWLAKLAAISLTGVVSLAITATAIWESIDGLRVFAGTVYPGSRRVTSSPVGLADAFGAPFLRGMIDQRPVGTNASELSTSFNIALVLVILLLPLQTSLWKNWRSRIDQWVLLGFSVLWFAWGTLDFGLVGARIPVLNIVPSYRAIQAVGFVAVILFFLMLARLESVQHSWVIMIAAVAAGISGYAGSLLQSAELPRLSTYMVWGGALGVGVVVYACLRWPTRVWPLALAAALASTITVGGFPVQIGLGDFRNSDVARVLLREGESARDKGGVWATDQMAFDALLVATGVPSLSGLQRAGPNEAQWHKLDPSGEEKTSWNRGAGYVKFEWSEGSPVTISDDGFDLILVKVDPCELAKRFPNLSHIVSSSRLNSACLRPVTRLTWSREDLIVYEVVG
jgi:hypothetical protein